MKLKCTASIGDIYWQVNEQSAEGLKSKRHSSSSNYQSFVHEDGNGPAGTYSTFIPGMSTVWALYILQAFHYELFCQFVYKNHSVF